MYNLEVVRTTLDHIDDIMVVENLSFSIPWVRDAFVEEITKNKFALYISAKIDKKVVGYAGMWKVIDEGHITNVAVHPEFRKCRIGSELMERLISEAKEAGVNTMTLEVRKGNFAAQRLYKNFGFTVEGVRKAYYADNGEDALIMWNNQI